MKITLRTFVAVALVVCLLPAYVDAQDQRRKKKNKNKDKDKVVVSNVVDLYRQNDFAAAAEAAEEVRKANRAKAEDLYVSGLAFEAAGSGVRAREVYGALAESRGEDDAWHWLGISARALTDGDIETAAAASARAVELDGGNKYTRYQLGMTLSHQRLYEPAAAEFARLLEIDGDFAYGHYYAGLSYYQMRSLVAAGNHFERFLELAPDAPERSQVEGILLALRGS